MRLPAVALAGMLVAACGASAASTASDAPAAAPSGDDAGTSLPAEGGSEGATDAHDAATSEAGDAGSYRSSLGTCWTDATCPRAMAIAHGGDWSTTTVPYDSLGAVTAAYAHGADGVKLDVRVTKDDVPVVAHSSPIQAYESLDCYDKRIEDMTAAEVTSCHFLPSVTETFQRLDTMLGYARGKMVVQLTVKLPTDYARTIAEVLTLGAEDFAFLEVSVSDLTTVLPPLAGADKVYYLANVASTLSDIDVLLGTVKNPRAFMVEMDPSPTASAAIGSKVHPAGLRAFTYDSAGAASVAELTALYDQGFDVVSSNVTPNELTARIAVNTKRGVTPP